MVKFTPKNARAAMKWQNSRQKMQEQRCNGKISA
jgi:hypothetical protein